MDKGSVLILDDEEDIGLMVSSMVKKAGFEPFYFNRVSSAREGLRENSFDYHLLDLNLPDGTGFDLIDSIKEESGPKSIAIISAYDSSQEVERARELGVTCFIKKPFTKGQILDFLNQ